MRNVDPLQSEARKGWLLEARSRIRTVRLTEAPDRRRGKTSGGVGMRERAKFSIGECVACMVFHASSCDEAMSRERGERSGGGGNEPTQA